MIRKLLKLISGPTQNEPGDIHEGCFAQELWGGQVGIVESVKNDVAVIAWSRDSRSILHVTMLRRVREGGWHWDTYTRRAK